MHFLGTCFFATGISWCDSSLLKSSFIGVKLRFWYTDWQKNERAILKGVLLVSANESVVLSEKKIILDNSTAVNKKQESLNDYLERLEREADNELQEFVALAPAYYSTEHLLDLRRIWLGEMQLFCQMHKMNLIIGACAPVWFGVGILFAVLEMQILTIITLCLFSVFIFTFLVASFAVKKRFRSRGYLEYIGNLLNDELHLRGIRVQRFDYKN